MSRRAGRFRPIVLVVAVVGAVGLGGALTENAWHDDPAPVKERSAVAPVGMPIERAVTDCRAWTRTDRTGPLTFRPGPAVSERSILGGVCRVADAEDSYWVSSIPRASACEEGSSNVTMPGSGEPPVITISRTGPRDDAYCDGSKGYTASSATYLTIDDVEELRVVYEDSLTASMDSDMAHDDARSISAAIADCAKSIDDGGGYFFAPVECIDLPRLVEASDELQDLRGGISLRSISGGYVLRIPFRDQSGAKVLVERHYDTVSNAVKREVADA